MKTRFGTTVKPTHSTGEGWMRVITEDGKEREWHISEMRIEDGDNENPVVKAALKGKVFSSKVKSIIDAIDQDMCISVTPYGD